MTGIPVSVSVRALARCLGRLIFLTWLGILVVPGDVRAQAVPVSGTATQFQFNISSKKLGDALDEYSRVTGVPVLIDNQYALRAASPVLGRYDAADALQRLLAGTGLRARYPRTQSIIVYGPPDASAPPSTPPVEVIATADIPGVTEQGANFGPYISQVQSALRSSLCALAVTRPGNYRLALQLRIDGRGGVERFRLLDTTGEPVRDAAIAGAIQGMNVGAPPPVAMPQPISILVLPEGPGSLPDCTAPADREH